MWSIGTATLLRTIAPDEYFCRETEGGGYNPLAVGMSVSLGGEDIPNPALLVAGGTGIIAFHL